ncbi:MAG: hypothetical protein [Inoviridae sp.]|nr:MAG: hypothetical protein [Inoviridae sp.]
MPDDKKGCSAFASCTLSEPRIVIRGESLTPYTPILKSGFCFSHLGALFFYFINLAITLAYFSSLALVFKSSLQAISTNAAPMIICCADSICPLGNSR